MMERGKQPQRLAAVKSLMAIRAPSSTGMLVKYFNHFPEEELRTEILGRSTRSPRPPSRSWS